MKLSLNRSDTLGAVASTMCMAHCLITPIVFMASSGTVKQANLSVPGWWINLDFLFLLISFLAIYRSTQTTSKAFMKPALWGNWFFLLLLIINEKMTLLHLPDFITYIAATTLASLHLYNLKYCQCKDENCCFKN